MNAAAAGKQVTVALADDHTLFREGVKQMLGSDPGLRVVGEAATGDDAIAVVTEVQPDVLLLDVEMPGPGAAAVIKQVRRVCPRTRIIILTMHGYAEVVHDLLDCGAAAYLTKSSLRVELIAAVTAVANNRGTVLLSLPRQTVEQMDGQRPGARAGLLTERELDVLHLVAKALSNAQIAARLHITEATVKRHLTNIYAKLNAVSRVDAIRKANAARLISTGDQ